jgi:Bacterial Ig-like domain (group 3)
VVQFSATFPAQYYTYALYAPGTTDASFATASSFSTNTPYWNAGKAVFDLQAPYNGTFILAVCENVNNNYCGNVDQGNGTNPMNPYVFTTRLAGGRETRTSLRLTAKSVRYGHEKGFRFTVGVAAIFSRGKPGGKAVIYAGKKALCTAKIVNGTGWCALSANTRLPAGTYAITAAYSGNRDPSTSLRSTLKVTR